MLETCKSESFEPWGAIFSTRSHSSMEGGGIFGVHHSLNLYSQTPQKGFLQSSRIIQASFGISGMPVVFFNGPACWNDFRIFQLSLTVMSLLSRPLHPYHCIPTIASLPLHPCCVPVAPCLSLGFPSAFLSLSLFFPEATVSTNSLCLCESRCLGNACLYHEPEILPTIT